MIALPPGVRIYLACGITDMRKGMVGLAMLVQQGLSGTAAAGGIALINALGNLGGFFGPYAFGLIKDATGGSFTYGLMVLALGPIVSATIILALGHDRRLEHIPGRDFPARRQGLP